MASKTSMILGACFLSILVLNSSHIAAASFQENTNSTVLRRELGAKSNISKLIPSLFRLFTIYDTGLTIKQILKLTISDIEDLIKGKCHCFTLCSSDIQLFLDVLQLFRGKSPIFIILDILGFAVSEIQSLVEKECNCTGCCFNSTFLQCKDCCQVPLSPSPSPSPLLSPSPSPLALPPRHFQSLTPSPLPSSISSPTPLPSSFSSPLPKSLYFSWTMMCIIYVLLHFIIVSGYSCN